MFGLLTKDVMMKPFSLILLSSLLIAGCTNLDRSRDLANPNVRPEVTARQLCSDCHGVDGNSVSPNFPKLAGQQEEYLVKQLQSFRHGERASEQSYQYMWGMTGTLTDEQIKGLAHYYNQHVMKLMSGNEMDKILLNKGKEIFENGIPAKQSSACKLCHGAAGEGMATIPRIAGQHAAYLVRQLVVFQENEGRPGTPMETVTHGLSTEEMDSVASYLQALGG
jgi:cytochrome c553